MPVVAAVVAAQVISGLVQSYNAEKARGAAADKLREIENAYKSIIPPNYDLSIQDPPALHAEAIQSPKFSQAVQSPSFDLTKFTPEKLKEVGQLAPQLAPFIKEVTPQLVKENETMKKGRQAQLDALETLTKVGKGGFNPEYAQKVQEATQRSQGQARAQQASLMDTMNRRGIGGSGLEMAAALQGNASAMNSAAQANQQAATDAYRDQLGALSQGASLGGQIYGQEQGLQSQNAAIINAFNQRMTAQQQDYEQRNADTMNQAAAQNLANKQSIANQNVNNTNQAAMAERQRLDELAKFGYSAATQQQQTANSLAQQQYQNALGERSYQNSIAQSLADWQNQQRSQRDAKLQQSFNNQMAITGAKTGNAQAQAQNSLQAAADRNQAISGLANAATTGATAYQSSIDKDTARQDEARQRELDRQAYSSRSYGSGR